MRCRRLQSGFSLLELIVVVLLVGILATGAGFLIQNPIDAYDSQVRRQQLVDQAELALRQIAIDVRRALPNSLRITTVGTGFAIEMINVVDGARYRDEAGGTDFVDPEHILDFTTNDAQFNFLGRITSASATALEAGDERIVIYNTPTVDIYAEAVDTSDYSGVITRGDMDLTLTTLPGTNGDEDNIHIETVGEEFLFTQQSPGQRAYIVDGPISYVCDPSTGLLERYQGYDYMATQPTNAAEFMIAGETVVSQLSGCVLDYDPGTATRAGLLTAQITITEVTASGDTEVVSLLHQMHVVNVP